MANLMWLMTPAFTLHRWPPHRRSSIVHDFVQEYLVTGLPQKLPISTGMHNHKPSSDSNRVCASSFCVSPVLHYAEDWQAWTLLQYPRTWLYQMEVLPKSSLIHCPLKNISKEKHHQESSGTDTRGALELWQVFTLAAIASILRFLVRPEWGNS